MKTHGQNQSLRKRFRNLSVRWSIVGLALTILLVVPTIIAVVHHSSERQVEVMATALSRAFRPMILKDHIRDAQIQMEAVAKLNSDESVTVLDPDFKPIYLEKLGDETPAHCNKADAPCWLSGGTRVSISTPIYFDDDTKHELYGYLILNLKPTVDWYEVILIILGAGVIFSLQVYGFYSSLKKESSRIERVLSSWKSRIDNPKLPDPTDADSRLFDEFLPLNEAIGSLQSTISQLESVAARDAATKAKIDIVRGIGHDLKTPLSQLSKFFMVFVTNTKANQTINEKEVDRIEKTMSRMGSLIRQVTDTGRRSEIPAPTNLTLWLTAYCNEFRTYSEIEQNGTAVEFECDEMSEILSGIHETDLFRLIDNIVRNAIESFPENYTDRGKIKISVKQVQDRPVVSVSDNGRGIPENIRDQIFDLDFTTKKSRGTGLGLGIVKKICTDLGLVLSFSSGETGTTFIVEFPGTQLKSFTNVLREEVNI